MVERVCCIKNCNIGAKWVCCNDEGDVIGYYCEEHAFQQMITGKVDKSYGGSYRWFKISNFVKSKTLTEIVTEEGIVSLERATYLLRKNVNEIMKIVEKEGLKIIVYEIPHTLQKRIYIKKELA